jgi:hypothetical protein
LGFLAGRVIRSRVTVDKKGFFKKLIVLC